MFNKLKLLLIIVFALLFINCDFTLTTGPDWEKLSELSWDSYIGVHPFGCDAQVQQPHLLKLIRANALRGVRLGNLDNPEVQRFAGWFYGHGVDVLGLFENEQLRNPNICQIFSQHVVQNPQIRFWEIGNEVQGFVNMGPEEYMKIATPLFYYAKRHHPYIKLAIGAVAGNGSSADDLRRMIDAGLDKLCRDGLEIVPIHFYGWDTARLQEFKSQIARLPAHVRIWITETNDMPARWFGQIGYVEKMYPRLKSSLRAERIYWYVFSEYSEFSLVMADTWEYSPLMKALIGMTNDNSLTSEEEFLNSPNFQNRPPVDTRDTKQARKKDGRRQ